MCSVRWQVTGRFQSLFLIQHNTIIYSGVWMKHSSLVELYVLLLCTRYVSYVYTWQQSLYLSINRMKNQRGHWVCWMSTRNNGLMSGTHETAVQQCSSVNVIFMRRVREFEMHLDTYDEMCY